MCAVCSEAGLESTGGTVSTEPSEADEEDHVSLASRPASTSKDGVNLRPASTESERFPMWWSRRGPALPLSGGGGGGGGVNLRLESDHRLLVMHNGEGLERTKQQAVWWSTTTCSSGAH